MFCTNCGKQMADGSLFCTSCGNKLTPAEQPKNEQVEPVQASPAEVPEVSPEQEASQVPAEVSEAPVAEIKPEQPKPVVNTTPIVSATSVVPPKKTSKGLITIVGAVVVVVILILLLGKGSGGGYAEYKDLVTNYYNAIYKNDYSAVIKMFDKDVQKEMKDYKEDVKDSVDSLRSDWNDTYDKGWNKQIKAASKNANGKGHYVVDVQIDGESVDTLFIKKVDDKYYLDEESSPFYE